MILVIKHHLERKPQGLWDFPLGKGRTAFDLSADGRLGLLAIAGEEVKLLDLETMQERDVKWRHEAAAERGTLRMVARPRLAADGRRCVLWKDARTLAVQSLAAPAEQGFEIPCDQAVTCAAISSDGRLVACCRQDGLMVVWDAVKQEEAFRSDQLCRTPPVYGKKPAQALCMEFSRDGRRLAIGTNVWTTVSIWNTGDWSPFQKPFTTGHGVRDVCFAPGAENLLWSADWQGDCCQFVSPPYYSGPSAGGASRSPPAVRLNVPVADLAVSPDGGLFAAAAWNGTARLFDPDPAKMQEDPAVLEHTGEVTSVDFSPDGKRLLTASTSGEVIIWDRRTRRRMFLWLQTEPVLQAAFATGGSRIVIARMDGMVRVRRVFDGRPLPERAPELLEELQGDGLGPDETPATLTGQGESKK